MKYVVIGFVVKVVFCFWIVGWKNVFVSGVVIFVSNYFFFVDLIFLLFVIDWLMLFFVKSDYFMGCGFKGWVMKFFMKVIGQIFID